MEANNVSRVLFKEFVEKNNLTKDDSSRNVFVKDGKKIAFSLINNKKNFVECRQFYSDCDGLVSYDQVLNVLLEFDKSDLIISQKPSRISPNGVFAFNAKGDYSLAKKSSYKM